MLKTENKIYKAILFICIICILFALYLDISLISNGQQTIGIIFHGILNAISLLYAIFYILNGYNKNASRYYRSFGILLAITQTFALAMVSFINPKTGNLIVVGLELITILVLVLSEDLGKNKSFVLCLILIILNGVSILMCGGTYVSHCNIFCKFTLSCLYGILTYAKYLDKASRGVK